MNINYLCEGNEILISLANSRESMNELMKIILPEIYNIDNVSGQLKLLGKLRRNINNYPSIIYFNIFKNISKNFIGPIVEDEIELNKMIEFYAQNEEKQNGKFENVKKQKIKYENSESENDNFDYNYSPKWKYEKNENGCPKNFKKHIIPLKSSMKDNLNENLQIRKNQPRYSTEEEDESEEKINFENLSKSKFSKNFENEISKICLKKNFRKIKGSNLSKRGKPQQSELSPLQQSPETNQHKPTMEEENEDSIPGKRNLEEVDAKNEFIEKYENSESENDNFDGCHSPKKNKQRRIRKRKEMNDEMEKYKEDSLFIEFPTNGRIGGIYFYDIDKCYNDIVNDKAAIKNVIDNAIYIISHGENDFIHLLRTHSL